MSRRPADPDPADDQTEVEDFEIRTIVYDDVDGDVVERRQLPAPAAVKPEQPVRRELSATAREPAKEPSRREREASMRDQEAGLRRVVAATVPAADRNAAVPRPPRSAAAAPTPAQPQPSRPMPAARRNPPAPAGSSAEAPIENGVVCPFCAHVRAPDDAACPRCTMADTPSTRRSTGERIGPWFVLQRKNPTAPGLRFSVILALARRGHVTAKSIVRGPTTGQLWRYAGEVKGLSRLFGICWHCRAGVSPDATTCPKCKSAQEVPDDPDLFLESHAAATAAGMADDAMTSTPIALTPAAPRDELEPVERPSRQLSRSAAVDRPAVEERAAPAPRPAHRPAAGSRGIDPMLSASELAAVFQMPSTQPAPAGVLKRTTRGAWRVLRVAAVATIVVGIAGAITFAVKPEWKAPTQNAVGPYWAATRDRTVEAAIVANNWARNTWQSATATVARWRNADSKPAPAMTSTATVAPAANSPAPTVQDAAVPPPTPIRPDPAASAAPTVVERPAPTPQGATSIVDAAPTPAPLPSVPAPAAAMHTEQTWDAILGPTAAKGATTKPADAAKPDATASAAAKAAPDVTATDVAARANAADPAAEGGTPPPTAPATEAATADRAAAMQAQLDAALRDADQALAEAQKNVRRSGLPGEATAAAAPPTPKPQPTNPTAANPSPAASAQQSPTMSLDMAMSQAASLRQKAIDAEARREWSEALKVWEQIEKLPEAARPSDLKVRLSIARDRVKR